MLDPTVYLGFGWMGVPLFFAIRLSTGRQVVHSKLDGAFLRRFGCGGFTQYSVGRAILLLLGTVIAELISPQGMATLPLQFLLWINLPPFMAQPINGVW